MNTNQLLKYLELENRSSLSLKITGGKIDSRKIREGEIFSLIEEIM